MKAILALAIISILWLPYCFAVTFRFKWEHWMENFLFGLIDWASI